MIFKKVLFMGTPEFAVPTLDALRTLITDESLFVVSKPDALKGRGKKMASCPVKTYATDNHLQIDTPSSKSELVSVVQSISPDLIIIIAYGMILPLEITDHFLCINIHASLLPNYRGPSPIHAALLAGDTTTGTTLMTINDKMDEGDILDIQEIPIDESDNFASLHDKLSYLGAKQLKDYLSNITSLDSINRTPQDHSKATYCKLMQTKDRELSWQLTPKQMLGKIRAFSPKPGAYLVHKGQKVHILDAEIDNEDICFLVVKPEGKSKMSYHDYCLGHPEGLTSTC
tara:strand:+ start:4508 stop:5365 length:858 start_codon:yes stop_codon:yes gene_type:complete